MNDILPTWVPTAACVCISIPLIIGAYTDIKKRIIPNGVSIAILILGCFTSIPFLTKFLSLAAMIIILVILNSNGAKSGGGDIKLYCALSFALGLYSTAVVLTINIVYNVIYAKLIRKMERMKGVPMPRCAFVTPAYITYLLGTFLLQSYFV